MALKRKGIGTSYFIGAPVGIVAVLLGLSLPTVLTGEGLATIGMVCLYGKAIVGLLVSFLIVLGFAGNAAAKDLEKNSPLLKTSFKYCLTINSVIWCVFIVITLADHYKDDFWTYLVLPVIAFGVCTAASTFTVGLLICDVIRQQMKADRTNG